MAQITLEDISLKNCVRTERVKALHKAYFKSMPELCVERPRMVTEISDEMGLFGKDQITILEKAKMYRKILNDRTPIVNQTLAYEKGKDGKEPTSFTIKAQSLFAGATTTKFKGVPIYPEFFGLSIWPELWSISTRKSNPFYLDKAAAETLNYDVFPRWMDCNINELARVKSDKEVGNLPGTDMSLMDIMNLIVFFLDSKPNCITHTIPNLERPIEKGLTAMIAEAEAKIDGAENPEFYEAIAEVMKGVIEYSENLSAEAARLAAEEQDPKRKQELLDMVDIYKLVPANPATTFREALTTVWVCWNALHLENVNIALSLGRMDQYLYKLYRQDIDNGDMKVEEAVELMCCLWLKIGDHVPLIPEAGEKLFGGSGSNQNITIGGVLDHPDDPTNPDKNIDAVNDLSYVILRSIELMQLRDPNL
ncbi:MAG: pyruvate formate lyase family protein, partial [Thermodesulfobacteriota bacterium]